MDARLIVILNDNDMSIAPPVGALSAICQADFVEDLSLGTASVLRTCRKSFPRRLRPSRQRAEEYARGMVTGGTLFEELGFLLRWPDRWPQYGHLDPGV